METRYLPIRIAIPLVFAAAMFPRLYQKQSPTSAFGEAPPVGVLDIYDRGKLKARFLRVRYLKADTNAGTCNDRLPCGFGRGVLDRNQNYTMDRGETEQFFDIRSYGTSFRYYEQPIHTDQRPEDWDFSNGADGSSS
jgi:hypothetical protein